MAEGKKLFFVVFFRLVDCESAWVGWAGRYLCSGLIGFNRSGE